MPYKSAANGSGLILVTGASGFVGSALVAKLAVERIETRACIRRGDVSIPGGVHTVRVGDLSGDTDWSHALTGVDVVVHCSGRAHVMKDSASDPLLAFRTVNVEGTLNLARQAVVAGVRKFVFVSSIGVNGLQTPRGNPFSEANKPNPHDAYALSKWEAEQGLTRIAEESGLAVVFIRPPLVYGHNAPGNFASLRRAVQCGLPLPLGAVHNKRSLVGLDNLVDFIITCITNPQADNQTFLVSDGHDLSTTELVRGMAQAAGMPARLLPVPVWALKASASLLGRGDTALRLCGNLQVDISKARSLLVWEPPVSVEEGLRRAMAV